MSAHTHTHARAQSGCAACRDGLLRCVFVIYHILLKNFLFAEFVCAVLSLFFSSFFRFATDHFCSKCESAMWRKSIFWIPFSAELCLEFRSFCLAFVTWYYICADAATLHHWHCTITYISLFHAMHIETINHFNNDNSASGPARSCMFAFCMPAGGKRAEKKETENETHKTLHYTYGVLCLLLRIFSSSQVVVAFCHNFHFFSCRCCSAGLTKMPSTKWTCEHEA